MLRSQNMFGQNGNNKSQKNFYLTDNPNHAVCFNNPIILARSDHWRKLLIKETLMIQQRNSDLNSDKASIPLYLFNV